MFVCVYTWECSIYISACEYVHMIAVPIEAKRGHQTLLDLELQVVVNCPMFVLETELGSSASTVPGLNP